jgi:hypothetical protein
MVIVTKGLTLDLNGHTLTADYVVAFKDNYIVDNSADKEGRLKVAKDNFALLSVAEDNVQLPIWSPAEGAYFFGTNVMLDKAPVVTESGDGFTYQFRPSLGKLKDENGTTIKNFVKIYFGDNGAADNGVEILVRLTWDKVMGDGTTKQVSQEFIFEDSLVKSTGNYLKLTISGITENITNLRVVGIMRTTDNLKFVGPEYSIN